MQNLKILPFMITTCIALSSCSYSIKSDGDSTVFSTTLSLIEQTKTENRLPVSTTNLQYAEDLQYLYETLINEQPHFNQSLFKSKVQDIENNLSNYNDTEFYYELRRILAASKDAHTRAYKNTNGTETIFPLWSIKKINNQWFIYGIQEKYKQCLGMELIKINGYSLEKVEQLAEPYISYENVTYLSTMFAEEIKTTEFLKHIGVINNIDSIPITLKDDDGNILDVMIDTFPSDDYNSYAGAWLETPKTSRNFEKNYYFTPLDNTTLFIQYNVCIEDDTESIMLFQQKLLDELKSKKYNTVIFDLRYNQGGMYSLFDNVIEEIGRSKNKLGFKLYCLIGEQTFSTGVLHAVQLEKLGATLVGTPTGGNVNFYATTKDLELPNSGIKISYSTKFEDTITGYNKDSLYPKIVVKQSVKDYAKGIDCDMKAIENISTSK